MIKPQAPPEVVRPHITEVIFVNNLEIFIIFDNNIDWYEPPAVQPPSEAGGPVQLCLPNTAGIQGNFLLPELPSELQTHQLGQLHDG